MIVTRSLILCATTLQGFSSALPTGVTVKMNSKAGGAAAGGLLLHYPSCRHLAASSPGSRRNGPGRRSGRALATRARCADAGPGPGPDH